LTSSNVLVLGSINVDVIAYADFSKAKSNYVLASEINTNPGGKGLNTAIGCAAFDGERLELLGRIGHDMYGEYAIKYARTQGINVDSIILDYSAQTGMGLLRVNTEGEYETVVIKGANENLSTADYSKYISNKGAPGYVIASLETPLATIRSVAEFTPEVQLVINVSPWSFGSRDVLSLSDIAVLNLSEARELTGQGERSRPENILHELRGLCAGTIVITLGEHGAVAIDADGAFFHVEAQPVEPVNTVGAGDSFLAALVMAISSGLGLNEAMVAANHAGRLACLSANSHLTNQDVLKIQELTGFSFTNGKRESQ
jgi:ribokinase